MIRKSIAWLLMVVGTALLGLGAMGLTDDALKEKCYSFERKLSDFEDSLVEDDSGSLGLVLPIPLSFFWIIGLLLLMFSLLTLLVFPLWPIARLLVSAGRVLGWDKAKLVETVGRSDIENTHEATTEMNDSMWHSPVSAILYMIVDSPRTFLTAVREYRVLLGALVFVLVFAPFVLLRGIWGWVTERVRRLPSPTSVLARIGLTLVALAATLDANGP